MSFSKPPKKILLLLGGFLVLLFSLFFFSRETNSQPSSFSIHQPLWHGGFWKAEGSQKVQKKTLMISGDLSVESNIFSDFARPEDEVLLLLTVERFFDEKGRANAINNEYFSTVLTSGGSPIEFSEGKFGASASCNQKQGVVITTPIEIQKFLSVAELQKKKTIHFDFEQYLGEEIPNGMYRPRLSLFYIPANTPAEKKCAPEYSFSVLQQTLFPKQEISLQKANPWGESNDFSDLQNQVFYLPFFTKGKYDTPKLPAVLFAQYSSQGSRGIVSEEDQKNFQIATHEIAQAPLILEKGEYEIDLSFPLAASYGADLQERYNRIPLKSGWIQGEITSPAGTKEVISRTELKNKKITAEGDFLSGQRMAWMTLTGEKMTRKFSESGKYSLFLAGEVQDKWGNTYQVGGEYSFFIGKKLTFVSAVKPGTSFFTGDVYIPRFGYNPPLPAKAHFSFDFFPFDPQKEPRHIVVEKEGLVGGFNSDVIPLDEPGEYFVKIVVEAEGGAYLGVYNAGSLVVSRDSGAMLHGKMGGNFFDTTEKVTTPRFSLPRNPARETQRDFFWPYFSGDVLKVASHEKNSVNPTVELFDTNDKKITIFPETEGNLHPFNYPEKITNPAFVFLDSQKAGFIGRSLVATDFIDHAFWNVTNQNFGGRLNASKNGDLENDLYRNFAAAYAHGFSASYISTLFIGAQDATEDKVFAPFEEPSVFNNGRDRLFIIGTSQRKDAKTPLSQYFHVTPPVKGIKINITATKPDGSQHRFPEVETDEGGFTPAGESVMLDQEGVWDILVEGEYQGKKDHEMYHIFAISPETVPLEINIPPFSSIDPQKEIIFTAKLPQNIQNPKFTYEVVMPGAVLDTREAGIGKSKIEGNILTYTLDPKKVANLYKNFEIDPFWARITIFYLHVSGELDGKPYNAFRSIMVRNNQMIVME